MTNKPKNFDKHFSRNIPISIILAMALQTITVVWWAAKLDNRVLAQEQWIQHHEYLAEKVFRLEERITSLHEEFNDFENRDANAR